MNTKLFSLFACLSWAGVATSYASPANAIAFTAQSGQYAACSGTYQVFAAGFCPSTEGLQVFTDYTQQIKMLTQACNSGSGCNQNGTVYTDTVYATGRKPATFNVTCNGPLGGPFNQYELGVCAC